MLFVKQCYKKIVVTLHHQNLKTKLSYGEFQII